ncbi:hypothetical protein [Duganella violaceipulchra]|uniref:HipA-like C-terminal domain-containing protein n=1 Tax=Duganella violaceipulchra TaxID=2849652 RepID=A0AA41L2W4_9BURK|nr:hypothetical protein [Duganella violaceicalia]MBV6320949.1 hypothetical protein [Duganella violaceicalia]MCP2008335.1 hypothetical protein [Duganella violaceicalia]
MPFFTRDLRPQGFLGRMEPGRNRDLDLPDNISHWTDEQILKYISRRSEPAAGDLILGNESCARYIESFAALERQVMPAGERVGRYPGMAEDAMRGESPGSSAGGEQPKFTAVIRREDEGVSVEHVIVKFSPQVGTPSGRRWGDLLICEHLQNWTAVARELGRLGELSGKDIMTVEILDLFGSFIGNTDKHHGNIAVSWTFEHKHRLLDAYDMLPMLYRPNAHGEIIEREWLPAYMGRVELRHLSKCYDMALQFWQDVADDPRISEDFKAVADRHVKAIRPFAPAAGA